MRDNVPAFKPSLNVTTWEVVTLYKADNDIKKGTFLLRGSGDKRKKGSNSARCKDCIKVRPN